MKNLKGTASFRGMSPAVGVRGDASVAELIGKVQNTFEEFKAANDERIKGVEAKFNGDDVLNREKVDRIDSSLHDVQDALATLTKRQAEAEVGGVGSSSDVAKELKLFNAANDLNLTIEQYQGYGDALNSYMRGGQRGPLAEMSVGEDPEGGYTVTPDMRGPRAGSPRRGGPT